MRVCKASTSMGLSSRRATRTVSYPLPSVLSLRHTVPFGKTEKNVASSLRTTSGRAFV
jgi:hypothetical protein